MLKNGQDHIPVLQAGAVVNVVPLRHVVAVDPGYALKPANSIRDAGGASAPGHGRASPAPAYPRSATRPGVRCRLRKRASRRTRPVNNGEPAHVGDAGWWLEQA
jgi:hypothetical protein